MTREEIYAALFAKLGTLKPSAGEPTDEQPLRTASRRLEFAEDVDLNRLPGVWQKQDNESGSSNFDGMGLWDLQVYWYVYVGAPDANAATSPLYNPIVDAVLGLMPNADDEEGPAAEAKLLVVDGVALTWGLSGPLRYYDGLLGNKAVVVIPVRVLAGVTGVPA